MGRLSGPHKIRVVLWEVNGKDEYAEPTVATGIEVKAIRWVEKVEESVDSNGNTIRTDGHVVIERDIPIDSILWKDRLNNLPTPVTDVDTLFQIINKYATPDIKQRKTFYRYDFIRFNDKLPTIS